MNRFDYQRYIGIPFLEHGVSEDGCDCYGLVCLIYRREYGIVLPHFEYADSYDKQSIDGHISSTVDGNSVWLQTEKPEHGDGVVFRRGRFNRHVGIWIEPNSTFIHCLEGVGTCLQSISDRAWSNRLVCSVKYRGVV